MDGFDGATRAAVAPLLRDLETHCMDEAKARRLQSKEAKTVRRRQASAADRPRPVASDAGSSAPAPAVFAAAVPPQESATTIDREIEKLNEQAREAKRAARKQAVVVAGLRPEVPAVAAADGERESGAEGAK